MFKDSHDYPCRDCGSEMVYVGEHWNDDEGWCSTYVCQKEYPDDVRRLRNAYRSHVYRCKKKHYCERCGSHGWEMKNKKCHSCDAPKPDHTKICDCYLSHSKGRENDGKEN